MTEVAGFSRSRRVLEPAFLEGISGLSLEEVRRRRAMALAEREFLSYLRRLVQVRRDALTAERQRRATGSAPPPMLEELQRVLSQGPPRARVRGEAVRVVLPAEDVEEAERRADDMVGRLIVDDPRALEDEHLAGAIDVLARGEREVSGDRSAVMRVHDSLQDELKNRYREDPSRALS
jgi:hypothetical protein